MATTIRRKVLKQFTRFIGGQIVSGDPKHHLEHGRFLEFEDPAVADILAAEGLIGEDNTSEKMPDLSKEKPASPVADALKGALTDTIHKLNDEAGSAEAEKASAGQRQRSEDGRGVGEGADEAGTVRRRRTAGQPVPDDEKGGKRAGNAAKRGRAAKGSTSTETTTNHPGESGPQTAPAHRPGTDDPDPDAAPTGGQ